MKKQTYNDLLQSYKNIGNTENQETFDFEGEKLPYPRHVLIAIHDETVESNKSEYRAHVRNNLREKIIEEELLNLFCKEKFKRYSKNVGLELLALTIEGASQFLRIGGMHINCDELREKKELTYYRYKAQQNQDITDNLYR